MRTLASLCHFAFIPVLLSFLSATAQNTTTLQPCCGSQVYATTIRFNLPSPGPVHLEVYDPLGRRVRELIPGSWMGAGEQRVVMDAGGVPSGQYAISLREGSHTLSHRVSVVK